MQEIQDMLNRMVYLAQQSANGTYDDAVDRKNLQKEVDALKSEINRIADSANFNGTKLLDGSLDKDGVKAITSQFDLPTTGAVLGKNTVLHVSDQLVNDRTTFSVDLHNLDFKNEPGKDLEIKFGDTTITLPGDYLAAGDHRTAESGTVTAAPEFKTTVAGVEVSFAATDDDLDKQLDAMVNALNGDATFSATWTAAKNAAGDGLEFTAANGAAQDAAMATPPEGATLKAGTGTKATSSAQLAAASTTAGTGSTFAVSIGGKSYDVADTNTTVEDQAAAWADAFNADAANTDWEAAAAADGTITLTAKKTGALADTGATSPFTGGTDVDGVSAVYELAPAETEVPSLTIGGYTANVSSADLADQLAEFVTAYNGDAANTDWTAAVNADGDGITFSSVATGENAPTTLPTGTTTSAEPMNAKDVVDAIMAGQAKVNGTAFDPANDKITIDGVDFTVTADGNRLTLTQDDPEQEATTDNKMVDGRMDVSIKIGGKEVLRGEGGDFNKSTTVITNKGENNAEKRIASTYFNLTADMVGEGASIKIGDKQYEFSTEKGKALSDPEHIKVDISDLDPKSKSYLSDVAERLTAAAKDNTVWTVGHDGDRITVTEYVDPNATNPDGTLQSYMDKAGIDPTTNKSLAEFDLSTEEGIAKSLGFTTATKEGGSLSLQIGDSSDSFNQLKVSIGDMHVAAMGIEGGMSISDIDISTQEGAQEAVDVIKSAINYVSSVRGDLGAISNRLDHTANNLSVMRENIQDAESTIRDTDIAEEMMSYTKNNILVQSAQAMLAQANQVPQGVLQLLQ